MSLNKIVPNRQNAISKTSETTLRDLEALLLDSMDPFDLPNNKAFIVLWLSFLEPDIVEHKEAERYLNMFPIGMLADSKRWGEIATLIENGDITKNDLHASLHNDQLGNKYHIVSILELFLEEKQFDLIEMMISKNILPKKVVGAVLKAECLGNENKGTTVLWLLADYKQGAIIETLNEKNLIRSELDTYCPTLFTRLR